MRRQTAYLAIRGGAALLFLLSAVAMPRGVVSALLVMAAGIIAVFTCIGVNAGGPGERAGAAAEDRLYRPVRPPQGDWPPYDESRVVEGELVEKPESGPPR